VATVNNGVVTAIALGTAVITVTTEDGGYKAKCHVTVGNEPVVSITIQAEIELEVGGITKQLIPTFMPPDATNKTIRWETSDSRVVTVAADGTATGKSLGTAVITAISHNYKTATCAVSVVPTPVTGITLPETATVDLDFWSRLPYQVLPANATNKAVTFSISDASGVRLNTTTGLVFGDALGGTATITVKTVEGEFEKSCAVTVVAYVPEFPMVLIPPGTFMMGVPEDEEGYDEDWIEVPQHQVTLTKGFYMATYQVSQKAYKAIMGANYSGFNVETHPDYAAYVDLWPVDGVNWFEAVEFCNKLSVAHDLDPVYTITERYPATTAYIMDAKVEVDWDKNGYRLPTEAEWEYACRAGTTTPFNFYDEETQQWGSNYIWIDQANFDGYEPYNGRETSPDSSEWYGMSLPGLYFSDYEADDFPDRGDYPNQWGLYSMHGNLEEWCWDVVDIYDEDAGALTDPKGPEPEDGYFGDVRALRGGTWYDPAVYVRSGARNGASPDTWYYDYWFFYLDVIGFRVVRNADGPAPKTMVAQSRPAKMMEGLRAVSKKNARIANTRIDDRKAGFSSVEHKSLRMKVLFE
jgi:formylglycine-generating enzyme required for sulfatase activity/uncharacterized protein YjdB